MIIARSPMRISLGGGGTDLPSYYREHDGFVIAAAIDKYVYITPHETFSEEVIVKYSKMEVVDKVEEIQHPIIREALKLVNIGVPHLEITSMSDIPAGIWPRVLGQLHHCPPAHAAHSEAEQRREARVGRTGLPHRNRPPG